jgi:hypothetical protein
MFNKPVPFNVSGTIIVTYHTRDRIELNKIEKYRINMTKIIISKINNELFKRKFTLRLSDELNIVYGTIEAVNELLYIDLIIGVNSTFTDNLKSLSDDNNIEMWNIDGSRKRIVAICNKLSEEIKEIICSSITSPEINVTCEIEVT